jgi:hypothetical protein
VLFHRARRSVEPSELEWPLPARVG